MNDAFNEDVLYEINIHDSHVDCRVKVFHGIHLIQIKAELDTTKSDKRKYHLTLLSKHAHHFFQNSNNIL